MTNKEKLILLGHFCSYKKSCNECSAKEICTKDIEEELTDKNKIKVIYGRS